MRIKLFLLLTALCFVLSGCENTVPSFSEKGSSVSFDTPASSSVSLNEPSIFSPTFSIDGAIIAPDEIPLIDKDSAGMPNFSFSESPELVSAEIISPDNTQVFLGELTKLSTFTPKYNGTYRVNISAIWAASPHHSAFTESYSIDILYSLPMTVNLESADFKQGSMMIINVNFLPADASPEDISVSTSLNFTPTFFPRDDGYTALFPIRAALTPGEYPLKVTCKEESCELIVNVADAGFNVQYFNMDPAVHSATLGNSAASEEFDHVTMPHLLSSDSQLYFKGDFVSPLSMYPLRITSNFGDTRYINGGFSGRHLGVDMAAPRGTPVLSVNKGKVLYSGFLQLTGNTVIIEHGFGLKSLYYHMDSLDVSAGDLVESGSRIGAVGTTGASTGYHLHFAVSINNVFTNPWQFLDGYAILP